MKDTLDRSRHYQLHKATFTDVFSRYVWLRPEIARQLQDIYNDHGLPKVHDQGKEFKGAVKNFMESLQVKIIQSSPYHP